MSVKRVINSDCFRPKYPLFPTITAWLALVHWNAAGWVYGAVGVFMLLAWISVIVKVIKYDFEEVDLFPEDEGKPHSHQKSSKWAERLEEVRKEQEKTKP